MASGGGGARRKEQPLVDFSEDGQDQGAAGGEPGDGLAGGDVDLQAWERRLASGDLPEDFLQVTEPTASLTNWNEKPKVKLTEEKVGLPTVSSDSPTAASSKSSGKEQRVFLESESSGPEKGPKTEENDWELAMALQRQLDMEASEGPLQVPRPTPYAMATPANVVGRLTVTVAEARLVRNYGLTRMDPYCRIRVGHCVYETPTCPNGAREPKWNRTFNCFLLQGVTNIDVEIYDECTFSADSMIAHATQRIPDEVITKGVVVDEWWPLSGQEGHDKEGAIHMVLSLQRLAEGGSPAVQQLQELTEEQLQDFSKMFPNIEKDIIKSVYVAKEGSLEETASVLLQMSQE